MELIIKQPYINRNQSISIFNFRTFLNINLERDSLYHSMKNDSTEKKTRRLLGKIQGLMELNSICSNCGGCWLKHKEIFRPNKENTNCKTMNHILCFYCSIVRQKQLGYNASFGVRIQRYNNTILCKIQKKERNKRGHKVTFSP